MTTLGLVILAAGHGTRMNSNKNKVLHEIGGRPMVAYIFESALTASDYPPLVVVSPSDEDIRDLLEDTARFAVQQQQMGTGHATLMAKPELQGKCDQVLVIYADMPLLRPETMIQLAKEQESSGAVIVMLTVMGDTSSSFGRVVRDARGEVAEIVEVAEAKQRPDVEELLQIHELNAGVYCFASDWLWENIDRLPLRQARTNEEYYLTDMVGIAAGDGKTVKGVVVQDTDECLGAGTRQELAVVEKALRTRVNKQWMASGVTMIDPEASYIETTASIGRDTVIWPNTYILGTSVIGESCKIGPNTIIRDAQIGRDCHIEQATIERVSVEDGTVVEPYSHLHG
jgi:bifunctional UDP-N-acetylglucosamine pyrophosphorylase/glucosamine-1-phosphate N-acetyltransferase